VVVKLAVAWHLSFRVRLLALLAAGAVAGLASAAPLQGAERADVDLTSVVVKARSAVGLPAVGANSAVRAAASAALGDADAHGAFSSSAETGTLVTATSPQEARFRRRR
jgi:hypothetical protein